MPCGSHALVASIIALAMPPASAACYCPVLRCSACGCTTNTGLQKSVKAARPRARVLSRHCAEICTKLRRFRLARVWVRRLYQCSLVATLTRACARVGPCCINVCQISDRSFAPRACGCCGYQGLQISAKAPRAPARVLSPSARQRCRADKKGSSRLRACGFSL